MIFIILYIGLLLLYPYNMELKEILKRHSCNNKRTASCMSLTSGNSPIICDMLEKLSLRELQLIRSLHLELTLESAAPDTSQQFLIDHIDHNISQLLDSSYTPLKHDRNTEMGFENRNKMKNLLE